MRIAVALLVLLAACGPGDPSAEPTTTTATTTTARPATHEVVATDGTVEVALTLPTDLVAGERIWGELTVRNVGDRTVWWQAGGRTPPGRAALTGLPAVEVPSREWSGAPDELAGALTRAHPDLAFVDEQHVGLTAIARTADSDLQPLAPGDRHRRRVAADLRLPPGPADLRLRVGGTFYDAPDHYGGPDAVGPRPDVVTEVPVRLDPPPDGDAEALAGFAADPRLAAFVEDTRVEEHLHGGWYAELTWWRGAWELTVTPEYGTQTRLRLRWADGEVVDARRIHGGQAPEDDPGGARHPGLPPDDVEQRPAG